MVYAKILRKERNVSLGIIVSSITLKLLLRTPDVSVRQTRVTQVPETPVDTNQDMNAIRQMRDEIEKLVDMMEVALQTIMARHKTTIKEHPPRCMMRKMASKFM